MAADNTIFSGIVGANNVYKFYNGGEWKESESGKTVANENPTTMETAYQMQGARLVTTAPRSASHAARSPAERCSMHPAGGEHDVRYG